MLLQLRTVMLQCRVGESSTSELAYAFVYTTAQLEPQTICTT